MENNKEEMMTPIVHTGAIQHRHTLEPDQVSALVYYLNEVIAPLPTNSGGYKAAPNRKGWWLQTIPGKGEKALSGAKPGIEDKLLWKIVTDLVEEHCGFTPDLALITLGGIGHGNKGIKPHRDDSYADFQAAAINLGYAMFHYEELRSTLDSNAPSHKDTILHRVQYEGGEVMTFNCKNKHSIPETAGDRWVINAWQIKTKFKSDNKEKEMQKISNQADLEYIEEHWDKKWAANVIANHFKYNQPDIQLVTNVSHPDDPADWGYIYAGSDYVGYIGVLNGNECLMVLDRDKERVLKIRVPMKKEKEMQQELFEYDIPEDNLWQEIGPDDDEPVAPPKQEEKTEPISQDLLTGVMVYKGITVMPDAIYAKSRTEVPPITREELKIEIAKTMGLIYIVIPDVWAGTHHHTHGYVEMNLPRIKGVPIRCFIKRCEGHKPKTGTAEDHRWVCKDHTNNKEAK